jgi:hypothetical protein
MSASFIDDPKVKEEPEFFKKYVRSNSNVEAAALISDPYTRKSSTKMTRKMSMATTNSS